MYFYEAKKGMIFVSVYNQLWKIKDIIDKDNMVIHRVKDKYNCYITQNHFNTEHYSYFVKCKASTIHQIFYAI